MHRVMLIGSFCKGAFEHFYSTAFIENGCEVFTFDIYDSEKRNCRLGMFGQFINKFLPVEAWIRKANREMILEIKKNNPNTIIVFGQCRVLTSTLAYIKTLEKHNLVYIWQDALINMSNIQINSLPLYDLICSYSKSNITILEDLGGKRVVWVPLASHQHINSEVNQNKDYKYDISFIGQWRPEREAAISFLINEFPELSIKIWGPDWKRRSNNKKIIQAWEGRSLYGKEFVQTIISSKLNLNIIDETNYPSANMRFFEIPCAGGLQICSDCPEMEAEFINGISIFYFHNYTELASIVKSLINDNSTINNVSNTANMMVMQNHTYKHRAQMILELLNN